MRNVETLAAVAADGKRVVVAMNKDKEEVSRVGGGCYFEEEHLVPA